MLDAQSGAWAMGGLVALGGMSFLSRWAWTHTQKRIDEAWLAIDKKATNEELIRVRNTLVDIFKELKQHDKEDQARHQALVVKFARMEATLEAILHRVSK